MFQVIIQEKIWFMKTDDREFLPEKVFEFLFRHQISAKLNINSTAMSAEEKQVKDVDSKESDSKQVNAMTKEYQLLYQWDLMQYEQTLRTNGYNSIGLHWEKLDQETLIKLGLKPLHAEKFRDAVRRYLHPDQYPSTNENEPKDLETNSNSNLNANQAQSNVFQEAKESRM